MIDGQPVGSRKKIMVTAMGFTQILAWGSSYYLPAVLAKPIATDTGWPLAWIVGGLSCALLVAGLCAPMVGRIIQERGGRTALTASSILLSVALLILGLSNSLPVFFAAWVIMGVGMSCGLYDAAFATVGRFYGKSARTTITTLTLFGGFASTVCWPLSAWLVEEHGWRTACFVYVAIHLAICLPLHLFAVPRLNARGSGKSDDVRIPERPADVPANARTFVLLAAILVMSALTASMLSVHLLTVFQLRGYELAVAVGFGALIGPSQVGARVIEMLAGKHYHPIYTMLASVTLIGVGVALLALNISLPALALIAYGAGNGLHTIARGALPLVLFDPAHYAMFMGRLAFPSLIIQALAPSLGAWLLSGDGTLMLACLGVVSIANIAATLLLWRNATSAHPACPSSEHLALMAA